MPEHTYQVRTARPAIRVPLSLLMHHRSHLQPRPLRRYHSLSPSIRALLLGTLPLWTLAASPTWISQVSTPFHRPSSRTRSVSFHPRPLHVVHRQKSRLCIISLAQRAPSHNQPRSADQVLQIHILRYDASAVPSHHTTTVTISQECNHSNSGVLARQLLRCKPHRVLPGAILRTLIRSRAAHRLLPSLLEAKPPYYLHLQAVRLRS